ncbi:hypothetical protein TNCV_5056201 [Trichonephila clavipes]|nr:hypothetical protein TNCV_5056201 [Trichonephila clavipes]
MVGHSRTNTSSAVDTERKAKFKEVQSATLDSLKTTLHEKKLGMIDGKDIIREVLRPRLIKPHPRWRPCFVLNSVIIRPGFDTFNGQILFQLHAALRAPQKLRVRLGNSDASTLLS